jgi:hypothetical protein
MQSHGANLVTRYVWRELPVATMVKAYGKSNETTRSNALRNLLRERRMEELPRRSVSAVERTARRDPDALGRRRKGGHAARRSARPGQAVIELLALRAVAAVLCARRGMRMAATLLGVGVVAELLRAAFAAARAGYVKPYTGTGFALWLPEVAFFLLPPAALVALTWRRELGAALWAVTAGYVALAYPALRGERLVSLYVAIYVATYVLATGLLIERAILQPLTRDEGALLCLTLAGLAGTILVTTFGAGEWWAVHVPNGAAYVAASLAALLPRPPGEAAPQGPAAAHSPATRPPASTRPRR